MAAMPERLAMLQRSIGSLRPQVDAVRVYLNNFDERPPFLSEQEGILSSDADGDQGDAGKFFWFNRESCDYYLTADDDLLYPPDYVERLVEEFDARNRKAIVAVHGFVFSKPIESYVTSRKEKYKCTYALCKAHSVHVVGAGTAILHPSTITIDSGTFNKRNMSDLQLAIAAQIQHIPMVVIPREEHWIKELQDAAPEHGHSIWKETKQDNGRALAIIARTAVGEWQLPADPIVA